MKLLGNFRTLIDFVSADPNYKPANSRIQIAGLEALYTSGQSAATNIKTTEAPYKVVVNARQAKFGEVPGRTGSAFRMAKASDAEKRILDDLETYRRKLSSQKKAKATRDDPSTPANEATKTHSVSQMSYDNQTGNVDGFVELLSTITSYSPNEDDLKITSLRAFAAELKAANDAVSSSFVPFSQARGTRDEVLYTGEDSVVNIARLVKAYVSAAFGTQSPLYKNIKGLKFEQKRQRG
jgi:hypothetical protein